MGGVWEESGRSLWEEPGRGLGGVWESSGGAWESLGGLVGASRSYYAPPTRTTTLGRRIIVIITVLIITTINIISNIITQCTQAQRTSTEEGARVGEAHFDLMAPRLDSWRSIVHTFVVYV